MIHNFNLVSLIAGKVQCKGDWTVGPDQNISTAISAILGSSAVLLDAILELLNCAKLS